MLGATRYAAAGAHGPVDQRLVRGGRAQHHLRVVNHLPLSSMRSGNAAVCAAGREGNYIWSASRMDISGGEEEISRVLSGIGNDARGREASIGTRSRTSDSSSMRNHDRDTGRTPARGRSCQPRGRSVASVPVAKTNGTKPQHPLPAQKVVRRGRAGNARLHRPHGPCTRPTDPVDKIRRRAREIRDRTRWTRANIDVACRARLPGFQGKNRGECGGGLAGERA